ncbi:MAG: hypothetical protein AAFY41_00530 [Bacteroidota bacterium]
MNRFKKHFPTILNWFFWSLLFFGFSWWHGSFEKPLSSDEITKYAEKIVALNPDLTTADIQENLRRDKGEPIYMVNAIKYFDEPVDVQNLSKPISASEAVKPYNAFVGQFLIKRGSYPIFLGDAFGETAAKWGVEYEGEWSRAVVVRYRSIRTLLDLATHPDFSQKFKYKKAALESTIAYPTEARLIASGLSILVFFILLSGALGAQLFINKYKI